MLDSLDSRRTALARIHPESENSPRRRRRGSPEIRSRRRSWMMMMMALVVSWWCVTVETTSALLRPFPTRRTATTTTLFVATDPTPDVSSFDKARPSWQPQPPSRRDHHNNNNKKRRERNRDAKDPVEVETAVQIALEALQQRVSALDADDDDHDDGTGTSTPPFPSVRDCNAALRAFGDAGDLLRALRLFGRMRKAARLRYRVRRRSRATGRLPTVPVPTLVTYSTLMSRAVRAGKPTVALRLWNMRPVDDERLEPDIKAINILMNCYAKLGNVERAKQVLNEMEPEPNIVTFNTVLNACQKARDLDTALEIKALMDDHYYVDGTIQPDARTYTTILATVARGKSRSSGEKDPTVALHLLQEMYQRSVSPNGMTYSAFIEACGRCERPDLALQGLRLMQRQKEREKKRRRLDHIVLDNEVGAWTSAINVCGKAGRWETAVRLFGAMKNFGCPPNTVTCGCLTDSLLRAGRTDETLSVLRYMKSEGIVPSEVMYASLMTRADRLVQLENRRPPAPDDEQVVAEESDTKAIEVYTELMMSLMEATEKKTHKIPRPISTAPDDSNTLLLKVFLVFQQMKAAGAEPDLACFNVLLRACARAGDVPRGLDVMRQIQTDPHLEPSDRSWRELLRAAATARQAETAETIWNQGIAYQSPNRRHVDEPIRQWVPSMASLQCLLMAYSREATVVTAEDADRRRELYERIVQTYDDVLMGERRMGLQRIDPMEMLDDRRVIVLVIHALVALHPLVSDSDYRKELQSTGRSLLQLECLRTDPPLSWSTQKAVETVRSWNLSP